MLKCTKDFRFTLTATNTGTPLGTDASPTLVDADVAHATLLTVQVESGIIRITEDESVPSATNGLLLDASTASASYQTVVPFHKVKFYAVADAVLSLAFYRGR